MSSISARANHGWAVGRVTQAGATWVSIVPVLVALVVFKLAISDGGRDPQALTLATSVIFALLALLVWTGVARPVAVSRPVLALVVVMAASSAWSVRPEASVREALLWMAYLGIVVVTASSLSGMAAARRLLDAAAVIAGWLCLIALFNFWGANNPGMRWYSTFYWPNPFAAFLLLVLPLQFIRMVHARTGREALFHGLLALLLAVSFVLTYSRGAWLSLAVVAPVALLVARPPSWITAVWRATVLAAMVTVAVIGLTHAAGPVSSGQTVAGRAASIADAGDVSIQGRWNFWRAGLEIFRDHPLGGSGAGTFGAVHARYQRDPRFYARDAHNLYVQTAAELGVAGMLAMGAVLLSVGALWFRSLAHARGKDEYPIIAGVGLGVAAYLAHSAVEMNWAFPANPAMVFVLLGVLAWYDRAVQAPAPSRRSWRRTGWHVAAVAALLIAIAAVQTMQWAHRQAVDGQRLARAGDWEAASGRFAQATRANPLHGGYHALRALAAMQVSGTGFPQAQVHLQRAMALDRTSAAHPLQLARLLVEQRAGDPAQRSDALRLVTHALSLDPLNRPEAYRLLARIYREAGRRADAEQVYREAAARYHGRSLSEGMPYLLLWPEVAALRVEWADLVARSGRPDEAAAILEALLAEDPRWVPAYLRLSDVRLSQGRVREAVEVLRRGLVHAPNAPPLRARLVTLLPRLRKGR